MKQYFRTIQPLDSHSPQWNATSIIGNNTARKKGGRKKISRRKINEKKKNYSLKKNLKRATQCAELTEDPSDRRLNRTTRKFQKTRSTGKMRSCVFQAFSCPLFSRRRRVAVGQAATASAFLLDILPVSSSLTWRHAHRPSRRSSKSYTPTKPDACGRDA